MRVPPPPAPGGHPEPRMTPPPVQGYPLPRSVQTRPSIHRPATDRLCRQLRLLPEAARGQLGRLRRAGAVLRGRAAPADVLPGAGPRLRLPAAGQGLPRRGGPERHPRRCRPPSPPRSPQSLNPVNFPVISSLLVVWSHADGLISLSGCVLRNG